MPDYRRNRVPCGAYFFTVNLLERQQDVLVRWIDIFPRGHKQFELGSFGLR